LDIISYAICYVIGLRPNLKGLGMRSRGSESDIPGWNPLSETNLHAVCDPTRKKIEMKEACESFCVFVCCMLCP
jgi:hypothetical protein